MIGRIAGRLEYKALDHVLIDVRGVGYIVFATDRTLAALPGPGEAVALYTDLLVREDLLQLFGFPTLVEKEWFRLLMMSDCSIDSEPSRNCEVASSSRDPESIDFQSSSAFRVSPASRNNWPR